jgi:hypothetical protein
MPSDKTLSRPTDLKVPPVSHRNEETIEGISMGIERDGYEARVRFPEKKIGRGKGRMSEPPSKSVQMFEAKHQKRRC